MFQEFNLSNIKVGIVAKGLIIVAIPLVFECGVVTLMANLESQAETAAAHAQRANEISTLINELIQELYTGVKNIKLSGRDFSASYDRRERIASAKAKIVRLKELIGNDNPQGLKTLLVAEAAVNEGDDMVTRAEKAVETNDQQELQRIRDQSKHFTTRVITPDLIALGEKQKEISDQNAPIQAEFRRQMRMVLWIALSTSILGTIVMALFTTRSVTRRLARLADNSRRIGRGEKLTYPMGGTDEISELDENLHRMAAEINQLLQRERIILQSARDIIFVVDSDLKILRISPSVEEVVGLDPEELVGSSCLALFDRERSKEAASTLLRFASGGEPDKADSKLEAVLLTETGKRISVLVSLSHISSDDSMLVILHDISALKEAERFKQDVVNMVSHDLRSPLTMVGHSLEMLEEGMFGDINEDGVKMLRRAEQATRQMTVLVSDLLDLEKLESGTLRLNVVTLSSAAILEQARVSTLDFASKSNCTVKVGSAQGFVSCDPDRVNQILVNLITNALKFSPAGKEVLLTAQQQGEMVLFGVKDEGRGISPEQQKDIFERFKQSRGEDSKGGFGLGLPICKILVEMHGGTIFVESSSTGSVFKFTLPHVRRQMGPAVTFSTSPGKG